jgi:hypothetical protein
VTAVKGRREDDERLTSGAILPVGASVRASEGGWRVGTVCQWEGGRAQGGLARAREQAEDGLKEEGSAGARGGGGRGFGLENGPAGGERVFLFFFLFSKSYFPFCIFFFWTNYFVGNLGDVLVINQGVCIWWKKI